MNAAPIITIYARHAIDCKYAGDETAKRCDCRKHLRWTHNGKRYRRKAGTRSWAEAEEIKRQLTDQLTGRAEPKLETAKTLSEAITVFVQDKRNQDVTPNVIGKYILALDRLRDYCNARNVYTVREINREIITGFCATWPAIYPSTVTRAKLRERYRSFLRYCFEAQWLERVPAWPAVKMEEPETQPLTAAQYAHLLDSIYVTVDNKETDRWQRKVHAFLQCMRWSGLAIRDAMTLPKAALRHDGRTYRITAKRAKTGSAVSVVIPPDVAEEMLAAAAINDNLDYFFWSGNGNPQSATSNWGQRYIVPVFKAAGLHGDCFMVSHRLRDTFAVHLLESGTPMEELSRLLGHTSIRTTEKHYAKWSKGRQARADAFVEGSWAALPMRRRTGAAKTSSDLNDRL